MVASSVLAVMIGVAFGLLLRAVDRERTAAQLARQSERVLAAAQGLDRLVLDLEGGRRGFALTGDARFLKPWRRAPRTLPALSRRLLRLTVVADDHARARAIVADVRAYVGEASTSLVDAPRARRAVEAARRWEAALRTEFDRFTATQRHSVAGVTGARAMPPRRRARRRSAASPPPCC